MAWKLATDVNIRMLPMHEQLFAFAYSYLEASKILCKDAIEHAERRDWSKGTVVLLNAAHSVELFLKATLIRFDKDFDISTPGHNINTLANEYEKRFTVEELHWDIPFRFVLPDLPTHQPKDLQKKISFPSIEYRYPFNKNGEPWAAIHSFEPYSFEKNLEKLADDYDRIYHYICG